MSSRVVVIALLALSACGPSEGTEPESTGSGTTGAEGVESGRFIPPEYVPVASCLTSPDLQGRTEAEVQACAGEPCSQAVEHTDPMVTLSWRLYCAEPRCAQDCYWHVRVYFENGKVSYTRVRHP
ncbi:MAG: hypothetical protein ACJ8AT_31405 [Hyalangium sp.]|uniref:hypothetical protein n=1 Tax=Hyalangium sp. TaxID=2028555 RepID=UPI00389A7824